MRKWKGIEAYQDARLISALLSDKDKAAARSGIELNKPTKGAVAKDVISLVSWKG